MRYLYLVLGLLCGATAFAQTSNSATFILPDVDADSGTNVCLPFTAINFSNGVEFSFGLQWDKPEDGGALTFDRVIIPSPTNLPFLGMDDFDFSFAGDGLITVQWGNYLGGQTCEDANGSVSLDDGEVIFEVCFNVDGPVASNHPIRFFDKPNTNPPGQPDNSVDIIFNKPPQCATGNDAFPGWTDGSVTIGVKPLILNIPEVEGNFQPGDTYCVDVNVESGFDDLKGMQFGLQFDSTVIRSTSATINPEFSRISNFNFNLFRGSSLYAVWNAFPDIPYSIPDGGTLFTVCFEIVGDCNDRTDIIPGDVVTNPNMRFRPADVNGENATLASIPFIGEGFRFIIDDCNPTGFDVVVGCPAGPVNFGDTEVCVEFRAGEDFINMTDIDYLINFDPSVLEFVDIQQRNGPMLIDANQGQDFDYDQAGNGVIAFEWSANGASRVTLAEGDVVFAACFNAIGFGGTSPIVVSDFRNNIESTDGFFDGLNPTNCAITVQQPDGVAVEFPDVGFSSTQDICFDVVVDGFTDVTDFSIYVFLPLGDFDFRSFVPSLPGISATELPGSGLVELTFSGGPITIPDGGSIGSMCYRATDEAAPGECIDLGIAAFIPSTVVTTESGGNSVNVESLNGEACVLFPNGFGLIVGDASGFINDQVCVPVSVTRFTDIIRVATSFNYSPSRLTFSSINLTGSNWPGLTVADFDDTTPGRIDLNWSSASPAGTNIVDQDTVMVFEICFDAGPEDGCLEVTPSDAATPPTTTPDGSGSIVYRTGEICLEDQLILLSISTLPASCDDSDDGMIIFETAPRPDNTETITIRTDQPRRFGNNGSVGGLLPGMVDYIIYNGSGLRLEGSIEVGVDPANAAVANIQNSNGEDGMLSCGDNPTAVISGRNNIGETWELFIELPGGGTRRVSNGNIAGDGTLVTSVNDPGTYIAEVTSAAGCSARDTLVIQPAMNPIAMAGDDIGLDCNGNGAELTGLGSSEGGNVAYEWRRVAIDGTVLDVVGNTRDVTVMLPGRYELEVTFTDLMCSQVDMIIVRDENDLPNSVLPTEAALNCDGSPVMLSIGPAEDDVVYTWTRSGFPMTPLSATTDYSTSELGTYVVDIRNSTTGCSRSDTVVVVPSRGVPEVAFPMALAINCNPDTTQLTVAYENVGPDTRYSWSSADGRVVITDLSVAQPRVTLPGTYKVVVSNGVCRDSATVEVAEGILPVVEAGMNTMLTCVDELRLTGRAESVRPGATLSSQWRLNGANVPMGAAISIVVTQPGTYYLDVTDDDTGCVGTDSVVVMAPTGFPEYELADTVRGLGCEPTTVRFGITGDDLSRYDVRWLNPEGQEIGTMTSVSTGVPGMHMVTITDQTSGCISMDSVLVIADAAIPPIVNFRQNTLDISCEGGPAVVDAAGSSDGDEFEYVWSVVTDGEEPSSQGNDTLVVRTAGVYRLTITNQANGCVTSRDMTVTDSRVFPQVEAVEGMTLDCDNRSTVIGINILDQPNDYSIQWFGNNPNDTLPVGTDRITVTEGGTYNAVVINPATSCVETVVIRVEDLIDSIATLAIMTPDSFDCNNSTITIDASGTELNNAPAENIVWTSFDGNNITPPTGSLIVSVDGPGDYEMAVTDVSGCVVRDTVTVEAATDTPFAQAGDPIEVECGDMPQLDGTGSTPGPLPGILYAWSASDGGEINSGDENNPRPFVSGPGTYQLIVTNLANGCADTSTTTVTLSEQVSAMLPADFTACGPPITVDGNLPPGTSGVWTAFNDEGSVWTSEESTATITEIGDGLSLVWTLSAGLGCENYSADTVRVGPEETPVANDDLLEIVGDNNIGSVNLLTNDQRTGPVTVNLLTQPEFGEVIINLNGDVTFEATLGIEGITTVDYEVCSVTCPDLCSQATLTIRADPSGVTPEVYNAISPNGDGMNDRFIFTILELRPDEFPDNEIIIFNRWGDVIYEAKPYNNDWDGTSNGGEMVPEGTYYYILRLNVGEGDIIRGDITVVR
ncbi:MAG: gliding motility-associated C-terminal domain-containing protein [Lewinella sp.]